MLFSPGRHNPMTVELESFLQRFGIQCGISRCFEQLAALRLHYDQAKNALRTGQHSAPNLLIFSYSTFAMQHVAGIVWDSGWAEGFIQPGLLELVEFDSEHHTDFVTTLTVYLRNSGNITNMSKSLNMHRNTSIYRMNRISEIMGVRLTDYDTMQQIIFSLRLLDYNKNNPLVTSPETCSTGSAKETQNIRC
jgi:DNA-binding PucR family transcriptional regulator